MSVDYSRQLSYITNNKRLTMNNKNQKSLREGIETIQEI